MSQHVFVHCAILRPWRKVPWTAPSVSSSSCHNTCIFPHIYLLLSGHNVHMNLVVIKRMVISVIDKHFGLVDTGEHWLDGNKNTITSFHGTSFSGAHCHYSILAQIKCIPYLILLLLHGILHLYSYLEV